MPLPTTSSRGLKILNLALPGQSTKVNRTQPLEQKGYLHKNETLLPRFGPKKEGDVFYMLPYETATFFKTVNKKNIEDLKNSILITNSNHCTDQPSSPIIQEMIIKEIEEILNIPKEINEQENNQPQVDQSYCVEPKIFSVVENVVFEVNSDCILQPNYELLQVSTDNVQNFSNENENSSTTVTVLYKEPEQGDNAEQQNTESNGISPINSAIDASISSPSSDTNEAGSRKRKLKAHDWIANRAKKLRNLGQQYVSKDSLKVRKAKAVKQPCAGCSYRCTEKFSAAERKDIFTRYWSLGDVTRQREFILRNMAEIVTVEPNEEDTEEGQHNNEEQRILNDEEENLEKTEPKKQEKNKISNQKIVESKRKANCAYSFPDSKSEGIRRRVCKPFFMSTLNISHRVIQTIRKKFKAGFMEGELRGKHKNHSKVSEEVKEGIRNHIKSIPHIESHYLRAQTTRQFIDGGRTIAGIHRDYTDKCKLDSQPFGNLTLFSRIFNNEFNLAFYVPKKDQCDFCVANENSDNTNNESVSKTYAAHLEEKNLSRIEKENDKSNSPNNVIVCSFDLQAALPTPNGDVSSFYYKSKLATYNLTIYELKTNIGLCNVWYEGTAARGANEISTFVFNYIEKKSLENETKFDLIFYSDNCSGQNKNKIILAMYMYALHKFQNINTITHKFLIRGHTQNEGDTMHSCIEKEIRRARRSGPIFVPAQYAQLIRTAKKKPPYYRVNEFDHTGILDFKALSSNLGKNNFTINSVYENFYFTDIKVMKVCREEPLKFYYKTTYSEEFKTVDCCQTKKTSKVTRKSSQSNCSMTVDEKLQYFESWGEKKAYTQPCGISEKKKKDLLSLVNMKHIPSSHSSFYENLRISNASVIDDN